MVVLTMLGILAVWVLLPLAPAILMFRLVPGNAITVSGPLANLTLNASGAIAAYFAVFVTIGFFIGDVKKSITPVPQQYWKVVGDIELVDTNGEPIKFGRFANAIKVATNPEIYHIDPNTASLWIKVVEGEGGFPSIRVEVEKFGSDVIKLDRGAQDLEWRDGNVIKIKRPLKLHQEPDRIPTVDRQGEVPREGENTSLSRR
jgi:hypothetical protein